jgi:hypothetical protein
MLPSLGSDVSFYFQFDDDDDLTVSFSIIQLLIDDYTICGLPSCCVCVCVYVSCHHQLFVPDIHLRLLFHFDHIQFLQSFTLFEIKLSF